MGVFLRLLVAGLCLTSSLLASYPVLQEIGKGTYSTVFLSKDAQDELVAVKKYEITDKNILNLLEENGISGKAYAQQLAEKEWRQGQLIDHPNIVKIREIFFEDAAAYVVMNYIEGKTEDSFEHYSLETRVIFMQQLLSAIEHLLLRNIVVDDLWLGNLLISNGKLTLLDLGGNEMINIDVKMAVGHYVEMMEHVVVCIGGEKGAKAVDQCKTLLSATLRGEMISGTHIRPLVSWVGAMQKELSAPILNNTFSLDSAEQVLTAHTELQAQYPSHISFSTAQHSKFLAYSLIAAEVLKKFSPDRYSRNIHLLRYPFDHLPKSLEDLFQRLPIREEFSLRKGRTLVALPYSRQVSLDLEKQLFVRSLRV